MNRRRALRVAGTAAAALVLCGHTPYGQWVVYRKKHLLISCHRADPDTYTLAQAVVAELAAYLPAAKARVARAPNAGRLASLLGTEQMDVAILSSADAVAMAAGTGRFAAYGPIALRLLVPVRDRLLVARVAFAERHAWLVTGALAGTELVPATPPPRASKASLGIPAAAPIWKGGRSLRPRNRERLLFQAASFPRPITLPIRSIGIGNTMVVPGLIETSCSAVK